MKRAVILLSILSFACSGVKGINTANPDASPEVKKLLTYLARLPERQDNRVISGQHAGALNRVPEIYDELVAGLHKETGKWVGLISVDYGQWWQAEEPDRALLNRTLLDYWNSGDRRTFLGRTPRKPGRAYHSGNRGEQGLDGRAGQGGRSPG